MAVITCHFLSDCLQRIVPFTAVLPVDQTFAGNYEPATPMRTLYLLHGLLGDHTDWLVRTRIEELAMQNNLAVIMPAGENAFYIDWTVLSHRDYGRFLGEELPAFTRRLFHLSDRREDTYIGGLSMGGFGALRNGLVYNETYGRIIALSSAAQIFEVSPTDPNYDVFHELDVIGDLEAARQTNVNPRVAAADLMQRHAADPSVPVPQLFMACGTNDSLLAPNHVLRDYFRELGISVDYYEDAYGHEWDFWNLMITKAIREWLPLSKASDIVDSGHVHV